MQSSEDRAPDVREFRLGSVVLHDCSAEQAAVAVDRAADEGRPLAVHLCNAYTLTLAAKHPRYADHLHWCSLNLVDGTPVAWSYRALTGRPSRGPVRGPSFMRRMLQRPGPRHFLYGGSPEVLAALEQVIADDFPQADVVGAVSPPFRPIEDLDLAELAEQLRRANAQVVWVGLGTPKQDVVVDRLARELGVVAVGVGAAFDFLSGQKREAPTILHGTGLEWTHRLVTEPRRLWRRYLVGNVEFVMLVMREMRSQRRARR